jgi:hypothetical protein
MLEIKYVKKKRTNISITNQHRVSQQNFKIGEHFSLQSRGNVFPLIRIDERIEHFHAQCFCVSPIRFHGNHK